MPIKTNITSWKYWDILINISIYLKNKTSFIFRRESVLQEFVWPLKSASTTDFFLSHFIHQPNNFFQNPDTQSYHLYWKPLTFDCPELVPQHCPEISPANCTLSILAPRAFSLQWSCQWPAGTHFPLILV